MTSILYVDDSMPDRRFFEIALTMSQPPFLRHGTRVETVDRPLLDLGSYRKHAGVVFDKMLGSRDGVEIDGFAEACRVATFDPLAHLVLRTGRDDVPANALSVLDYVCWKDGAGKELGAVYETLPVMRAWMRAVDSEKTGRRMDKIAWVGPLEPTIAIDRRLDAPPADLKELEQWSGVVFSGPWAQAYEHSQNAHVECKYLPIVVVCDAESRPSDYRPDGLMWADYVAWPGTLYNPKAVLANWLRRFR